MAFLKQEARVVERFQIIVVAHRISLPHSSRLSDSAGFWCTLWYLSPGAGFCPSARMLSLRPSRNGRTPPLKTERP